MPPFRFSTEAVQFVRELNDLLNGTVCNGPKLTQVPTEDPLGVVVGFNINKRSLTGGAIPLTLDRKPARAHLYVSIRLSADAEGDHLMVVSSVTALYRDAALEHELLHYDYERDKGDGYPEAHVQVCAGSEAWTKLMSAAGRRRDALKDLHLPVGGRRFRPTLEDVVELLAAERLVEMRPGWEEHVVDGRERFRRKQLGAAVRAYPEEAAEALEREGWTVAAP